jgi:uncharacterized RDD family membrane protein YckC
MSRRARRAAARRAADRHERRLIRDFLPPEGVPLKFEVAPLGARFSAQILDLLATGLFALALAVLLAATDALAPPAIELIGWLLFLFVRAPYYIAAELVWNGQTLGKRARALRVVGADGRSLRPYAVAVRNIMKELEVFVPGTALFMAPLLSPPEYVLLLAWIAILLAVPLLNRRRQRLGDMIAGTYVIRQPQAVLMPDVAARAARPAAETAPRFTFLPHQLDHYGAFELQTLEQVLHAQTNRGRTRRPDRAAARRHSDTLIAIADRIRAKIAYTEPVEARDVPAFLEAFYLAQRRYLENRKLFGEARADKYHAEAKRRPTATEGGSR